MTSRFEDLVRSTLTDLAEEIPLVEDQTERAVARARRRRTTLMVASAAAVAAALAVGMPLAYAASADLNPVQPIITHSPTPQPTPSISPGSPIPSGSPGEPTPSRPPQSPDPSASANAGVGTMPPPSGPPQTASPNYPPSPSASD